MGRPRTHPPKQPADPAHVSAVRRAAALASAKARAERSIYKGVKPKAVHVHPDTFAKVEEAAAKLSKTITETATEAIEHGLPHILGS